MYQNQFKKKNITTFFLSSIEKNNNKYLSLSEAMDKNQVQISEVNKKGLLTKLSVSNKSSNNIIILGGEIISDFSFAMLWGIVVGTYSSIFIASTILIYLNVRSYSEKKEN